MLGYFSLVGLLRLHSLLGDYYQAVKALENIDIHKKVCASRIWNINYHFSYCQFVGFVLEPFFFGSGLPNHHGILRWLCLHDDATLRWRHPYIQFGIVVFAKSQAVVPVSYLSEWSGFICFFLLNVCFIFEFIIWTEIFIRRSTNKPSKCISCCLYVSYYIRNTSMSLFSKLCVRKIWLTKLPECKVVI